MMKRILNLVLLLSVCSMMALECQAQSRRPIASETSAPSYSGRGDYRGHDYVDLGLPSGVKWATCNLGASTPSATGDYYSWGETSTKSYYSADNNPWYYINHADLKSRGVIDGDGNLTPRYDVATQKWGGSWRIPTKADIDELVDVCDWTYTTINGRNGYRVTGPNGNSIFLPMAGYYEGSSLTAGNKEGNYLSATINKNENCSFHYYLYTSPGSHATLTYGLQSEGYPVRPVSY